MSLKKILVPYDGSSHSKHALKMAISLAKKYRGNIVGLYVNDLPLLLEYSIIDPVGLRDISHGKRILQYAKNLVVKDKIKFQSKIVTGPAAESILNYAQKNKVDIIIIGHRGMSTTKEVFLGSVSHHVLQKTKIPVLVVR